MQRDGDLAVTGLVAGVAVHERDRRQAHQDERGDRDAGDHRVEVAQQLLQSQEVPRGLRRVRREVGVGQLAQRRVDERGEHGQRHRQDEHGDELFDQQVRPHVDAIALFAFDALDALGRHQGKQAVLLVGALLGGGGHVAGGQGCFPHRGRDRGRHHGGGTSCHGRSHRSGSGGCSGRRGVAVARGGGRRSGLRRLLQLRGFLGVGFAPDADGLRARTALGDAPVDPRRGLRVEHRLVGVHVLGGLFPAHRRLPTTVPRCRRPCGCARSAPPGRSPTRTAARARGARTSGAACPAPPPRRPAAGSWPAWR